MDPGGRRGARVKRPVSSRIFFASRGNSSCRSLPGIVASAQGGNVRGKAFLMARDEREIRIFPTSLYTIRFVFNREPRATDEGRARGGRSDRRNLRSRRVRGSTDPEDPQDPSLRALVRLRVAPA